MDAPDFNRSGRIVVDLHIERAQFLLISIINLLSGQIRLLYSHSTRPDINGERAYFISVGTFLHH
jgi:hypothetical protein